MLEKGIEIGTATLGSNLSINIGNSLFCKAGEIVGTVGFAFAGLPEASSAHCILRISRGQEEGWDRKRL